MSDKVDLGFAKTEGRHLFGTVAHTYHRVRPRYPAAIYDVLARDCGLGPGCAALEIGPGTGIATEELIARGAGPVLAVEPDPALAQFLRTRMDVAIVEAPFEDAAIADAAFDLAACATAFHWLDEDKALAKIARALKPGGWWACWWIEHGASEGADAFHEATTHLFDGLTPGPSRAAQPNLVSEGENAPPPLAFSRQTAARIAAVARAGAFEPARHAEFAFVNSSSAADVRALYSTFSPVIRLPEPERTAFLDAVEHIAADDFGGRVDRPMVATLYWAQRLSRI